MRRGFFIPAAYCTGSWEKGKKRVNLEKSEKILNTVLEALRHTDDGILINDWEETVLYCNRSFLSRIGLDPDGDYRGKNLRDLLPENIYPILDEFREHLLEDGRYSRLLDAEVNERDYKVHVLSTLIREMEPSVVVSTIRDVTELEKAKRLLEARSRELAFLNEIYSQSNKLMDPNEILIDVMGRLREFCKGITYGIYKMCENGEHAELISSYGISEEYLDRIRVISVNSEVQQALLKIDGVIVLDEELKEEMAKREWVRNELGIMRTIAFNFFIRGRVYYFAYIGLGEDRDVPKELKRFFALAKEQLNSLLERIFLLDELTKREKELKSLTSQILDSIENERRDIAMALHDETEQYIAAANMDLDVLASRIEAGLDNELKKLLTSIREKLNHISHSAKKISSALHPAMLEDLGLIPAIQWFINEFVARDNVKVNFDAMGFDERLPGNIEVVLYRVAQEALTNVIKHAEANEVSVKLTKGYPDVILVVEDNGKGFSPGDVKQLKGKLGLAGMRERVSGLGGTLSIRSSPGRGTRIRATFPMGVKNG